MLRRSAIGRLQQRKFYDTATNTATAFRPEWRIRRKLPGDREWQRRAIDRPHGCGHDA
jgi:hypothetical protein